MKMLRLSRAAIGCGLLAGVLSAHAMELDWSFHSASGEDNRATQFVPGQAFTFLGNGKTEIPDDEGITIYVMTANQFAGDADEQVFVRWWNGDREHWLIAEWFANAVLDVSGENAGLFRGKPEFGSVMVDIWKVYIPPEYTRRGDNYYVIQLKAWSPLGAIESYLLRDTGAEGAKVNNLGQAWIDHADYHDHDWKIVIRE